MSFWTSSEYLENLLIVRLHTFTGASFLNMMIYCFSLSYMIVTRSKLQSSQNICGFSTIGSGKLQHKNMHRLFWNEWMNFYKGKGYKHKVRLKEYENTMKRNEHVWHSDTHRYKSLWIHLIYIAPIIQTCSPKCFIEQKVKTEIDNNEQKFAM